jgi:hypothetical protein
MIELFYIIVWFGLVLSVVVDNLVVISRFAAASLESNAIGAYMSQVLSLLSRFSVVLFLPFSALLIDLGAKSDNFIFLYFVCAVSMVLIITFLFLKRDHFYKFFITRVKKLLPNKTLNDKGIIKYTIVKSDLRETLFIASFFVASINIIGLTVPIIVSSIYTDYSTFLSHLGGIINVSATLVNTFILERKISISFESSLENDKILVLLIVSRIFAYFFVALFFLFWFQLT